MVLRQRVDLCLLAVRALNRAAPHVAPKTPAAKVPRRPEGQKQAPYDLDAKINLMGQVSEMLSHERHDEAAKVLMLQVKDYITAQATKNAKKSVGVLL